MNSWARAHSRGPTSTTPCMPHPAACHADVHGIATSTGAEQCKTSKHASKQQLSHMPQEGQRDRLCISNTLHLLRLALHPKGCTGGPKRCKYRRRSPACSQPPPLAAPPGIPYKVTQSSRRVSTETHIPASPSLLPAGPCLARLWHLELPNTSVPVRYA